MVKRNKYSREINGRTYYVHVFEWWIVTTVTISNKYYVGSGAKKYVKQRRFFCDDVERFSAKMLSRAVQKRVEG